MKKEMTEKQVGKRYRLLAIGERIKKGDECFYYPRWKDAHDISFVDVVGAAHLPIRRPMSEPSPLTEAEREVIKAAKLWVVNPNSINITTLANTVVSLEYVERQQSTLVSTQEARESGRWVLFVRQNRKWNVIADWEIPYESTTSTIYYLFPENFTIPTKMPIDHETLISLGFKQIMVDNISEN